MWNSGSTLMINRYQIGGTVSKYADVVRCLIHKEEVNAPLATSKE